jgi:hypothetical protein
MSETVWQQFDEDTADPVVMQLGTAASPQNLTGMTALIRLKDLDTGEVITGGTTTIRSPNTLGLVERYFEPAEKVAGRKFVVECVTTDAEGKERTHPDPEKRRLEVHIVARRTAA